MSCARHADRNLTNHVDQLREVLVLLGARQVGKTTIIQKLFPNAQYLTLDNEVTRKNLSSYDISVYKQIISPKGIVVFDEIHLLSDPGRAAKIVYDQMPEVNLIITGSSALNIKNKASESLAGRKVDYHLFPLTFSEYLRQNQLTPDLDYRVYENITNDAQPVPRVKTFDLETTLTNVLNYGLYPSVINHPAKQKYLENLVDSVIFKDLLDLKLIDDRRSALDTLKLIAHQTGQLVNYAEIAQRVGKDVRTVRKYIQIFHQSYITYELLPYSSNKRDEIGKSPKIYFWDTGLRNALIGDFSPLNTRSDLGQLFESFIITEFHKANHYLSANWNANYWRTKFGSEVDLVLSSGTNQILGVEIKYNKSHFTQAFSNRYPKAQTKLITAENFY